MGQHGGAAAGRGRARRSSVATRLFNRSRFAWTADGAARVNLAYHWLDASGKQIVEDGLRTPMPWPVPPGGRVSVQQKVLAPPAPGRYILELDPVFETVVLVLGEERRQDPADPDRGACRGRLRCSITCARTPAGCG